MLGLIIGLIAAAVCKFVHGYADPDAFLVGATWGFYFYLVTGIIRTVVVAGASLGITGVATATASRSGGAAGGVIGFIGGGIVGIVILAFSLLYPALTIGGSYLLSISGSFGMEFAAFNQDYLLWGAILLGIGVLLSLFSRSSSKSD